MIDATIDHMKGKIALHKANVEVYLQNPAGIGEQIGRAHVRTPVTS